MTKTQISKLKTNFGLLAFIFLTACTTLLVDPEEDHSTISFSKIDPSEIRYDSNYAFMPYGLGPIVDLTFGSFHDSVAVYFPADTSIIEVSLWMKGDKEPLEINRRGDFTLTLSPEFSAIYIYTDYGPFRAEYIGGEEFGYVIINDKIVATCDLATWQFTRGSGALPEDFFWAPSDKYSSLQGMKKMP